MTRAPQGLRIIGQLEGDVFDATFHGAPAVAKLMHPIELGVMTAAQGPGVVRVLHSSPASCASYPTEDYGRPIRTKARMLAVMEKLETAGFYPTRRNDFLIDLTCLLESDKVSLQTFDVVALSTRRRQLLLELLHAVVALNDKAILWGDLKEENTGVDAEGHLRIFDFGSARAAGTKYGDDEVRDAPVGWPITDANRAMDIVAFGKLVYNTLVGKLVFNPGRHYLAHRQPLDTAGLVSTVSRLSGATPLAGALRECFRLGFNHGYDERNELRLSTSAEVRSVVRAFSAALAPRPEPPVGLFVFYHRLPGASWEWPVMPERWAHAGWGGTNNAQYPHEQLFEGPRETLVEAEQALAATLAEQLRLGAITRFAVEHTYTETPGPLMV
jgi:hypothetical protein